MLVRSCFLITLIQTNIQIYFDQKVKAKNIHIYFYKKKYWKEYMNKFIKLKFIHIKIQ